MPAWTAGIARRLGSAAARARHRSWPSAAVGAFALFVIVAVIASDGAPSPIAGWSHAGPTPSGAVASHSPGISHATAAIPLPTETARPNAATEAPLAADVHPSSSATAANCLALDNVACPPPSSPSPFPSMVAAGTPFTTRVPIFEYHRVKPDEGETGFAADLITTPETFRAQMDAMAAAGWTTITLGQLGDDLRLGIRPATNTFVVTFDDGYEDGYLNAFPILRSKGFAATFFVIASRIGSPGNLTTEELRELVAAGDEIGNHSWSHTSLEAKTPQELVGETIGASSVIAADTGVWPKSYSYPMGLRDSAVMDAVAITPGIEIAVVQEETRAQSWRTRLQLPRIRVGPSTYPLELVDRANRYQS